MLSKYKNIMYCYGIEYNKRLKQDLCQILGINKFISRLISFNFYYLFLIVIETTG